MTGLTSHLANVLWARASGPTVRLVSWPSSPGDCRSCQRCTIYGDGEQTRDYVFVADVAEAADLALASSARGVGQHLDWPETSVNASAIGTIAAASGTVCDPGVRRAAHREVRRSVLANTHARALLGWALRAIRSSAASRRRSSG